MATAMAGVSSLSLSSSFPLLRSRFPAICQPPVARSYSLVLPDPGLSPLLLLSQKDKCSLVAHSVAEILTGETDSGKEGSVEEKAPLDEISKLKLESELLKKKAKRAELRRKRLVRKRHMRKKGRWPPSKMRKLKNV